ncbi:UNVERIFIED_CONTAM: hypothetical protein Slati_0824300 [Sesamum latifolium]|uniref:RNase H type-1 domain-containing protein n=1 Tax=Sesamum latifolium TaxID=2727402 RepID=A0AAW2XM62_9LAMI
MTTPYPSREVWLLHADGSATIHRTGAEVVITSPKGDDIESVARFDFKAPNNEAVYKTLVLDMRIAWEAGARHLIAYSDSPHIVKQLKERIKLKRIA